VTKTASRLFENLYRADGDANARFLLVGCLLTDVEPARREFNQLPKWDDPSSQTHDKVHSTVRFKDLAGPNVCIVNRCLRSEAALRWLSTCRNSCL
jgi:hypothetical protein